MAVWDCKDYGMYLVTDFDESELRRIHNALNDFDSSHGIASGIAKNLKEGIEKKIIKIEVLQKFSKWCDWRHLHSEEQAIIVSKLLFNGIQLPRLVDEKNKPISEYKKLLDEFFSKVKANNSTAHSVAIEGKTMNTPIKNNIRRTSLNTILYGPPGTGKTYHTKKFAVELIESNEEDFPNKNEMDEYYELYLNAQIEFVTFHPSYSYEDFVEGIRPVIRENNIGSAQFEYHEGIFKEICRRAFDGLISFINMNQQEVSSQETNSIPNFNWESFISEQGNIHSQTISLKEDADKWAKVPKYVLIIDEINRGDMSKIFGELITLIEPDKRLGCNNKLTSRLPYTKHLFAIPPNLYILGTMNTADRSLALIDIALRRRFDFKEMKPAFEELLNKPPDFGIDDQVGESSLFKSSIIAAANLNKLLGNDPDIGKDKKIGHAFFCNLRTESDIGIVWRNKIFPLLEEYFYFDRNKLYEISGGSYTVSNGWNIQDEGLESFIRQWSNNNDVENK